MLLIIILCLGSKINKETLFVTLTMHIIAVACLEISKGRGISKNFRAPKIIENRHFHTKNMVICHTMMYCFFLLLLFKF